MSRTLRTVAVLGLGTAVILVGAAAMLSGGHLRIPGIAQDGFNWQKTATRDFAWDGGDRLEIDVPATVQLVSGTTPRLTIRATADALARLRVHQGVIDMSASPYFWDHDHIDVTLSGVTLRDIALAGSGKLVLGHIDQDRLAVSLSGAGEAQGEGRVDDLEATISGTGDLRFGRLAAKTASLTISGVGNADINASDQAEITLSGVGNARLLTRPKKLVQHISGVGHVEGPDGDIGSKDD